MITAAKKRPLCVICIILMLLVLLAKTAGLPLFGEPPDDPELSACAEQKQTVWIVGTVKTRTRKSRSVQYVLTNSYLRSEKQTIPLNTISMTSKEETFFTAGSLLLVSGTIAVPEKAANPGQFDLNAYYASRRIYYSVYADQVSLLREGGGLREQLLKIKQVCSARVDSIADPAAAEVIKAMLLGDRADLTADSRRAYQVGGILHILAISGMHITLLGQGILKLLQKAGLPFPAAAVSAMLFLILYCLMTGAAPSAVRAVCMFAVMLGARLLLRTYDALCALALAGILLLLENPGTLFDSGFQLSFGAILAVSLVWPSVSWVLPGQVSKPGSLFRRAGRGKAEKKELLRITGKRWSRYYGRLLLRTGSFWFVINMTLLPLTVWYYHEISVWGLLPNLLLLPAAPVLLVSGTAGILAGMVSEKAGKLVILPAEWILKGMQMLTDRIRELPCATLVCGKPELWQVLSACFLLILLTAVLHRRKCLAEKARKPGKNKLKKTARRLALAGAVLSLAVLLFRWRPLWSLTMLDVGQGDCLVLRDRTGCFLVDGGSSSVPEVGTYRILPYLRSQGISRLDGIFVSHPDTDHINGILEILQTVKEKNATLDIQALYLPLWMKGTEEEQELTAGAEGIGAEVRYLARGDRIRTDVMEIQVLHPFYEGGIRNGNSGSMVLSLSCGQFDALLTGDLEREGEQELLPLERTYEYLKAGHHGSKGASSEEFLRQVRPVITAVSAPADSRYGHPHQETLKRLEDVGSQIFVTRDCGAIILEGNRSSWSLRRYSSCKSVGSGV